MGSNPFLLLWLALPAVVLNTALALDLSLPWRLATFSTILCINLSLFAFVPAPNPYDGYLLGCFLGISLLEVFYLLFLVDPLRTWRHKDCKRPIHEEPYFRRWLWMASASASPRGIGWNYRVKNTPEPVKGSRSAFILLCIRRAVKHFLWLELCDLWVRYNPVFSTQASITSQGYVLRCINILALYRFYSETNLFYYSGAAFMVFIGIDDPSSWPDYFGKFRDAYTLRSFWGCTWHQSLRRWTSSFGRKAARGLGFKQGTTASSYVQLFVILLLSGVSHTPGDILVAPSLFGMSLKFFMQQAVAITFEDGVIVLARRVGINENQWTRMIGYVWVWWWFSHCLPPMFDAITSYVSVTRYYPVDPTVIEILGGKLGWDVGVIMTAFFNRLN